MPRVAVTALVALIGGALLPHSLDDAAVTRDELGPAPAAEQLPPIHVHVYEYGFEPSRLVIKAGHVVVWKNIGEELHNVTPSTKAGEKVFKTAATSGTTRQQFTKPGIYPYYCSIHPQMRGVIVVRARV